jgi:hypothetical protein
MRKVIRRRIRRSEGGVNLAADVDASISVNTGNEGETTHTQVRSSHSVVQGGAGGRDRPDEPRREHDRSPKERP